MSELTEQTIKVLEGIARLEEGQSNTNAHLTKINGSIGHLWDEVNVTKRTILEHALECPLKARVDELDAMLLSGDHPGSIKINERVAALEQKESSVCAAAAANRKWTEWVLKPLIIAVLVVITVLALGHARAVLPLLGGK